MFVFTEHVVCVYRTCCLCLQNMLFVFTEHDISLGERCSALHAACLNGFPEIVKILVENNADLQEKGGKFLNFT